MRTKQLSRALSALMTALLTGSVITACSSGDEEDTTEGPVDAPVPGVSVTVDDPGEGPTEPLVWFNDDTEQHSVFRATQGLEQRTEGGDASDLDTEDSDVLESDDLPYEEVTMELPLSATTDTDGEELESTVAVSGPPTGDNTDLNEEIASGEGFTMTQNHSQDGRVSSRGFSAPENASDSARLNVEQSLTQMTDIPLVFPSDELGVGARWTVNGQADDQMLGISMRQAVTYTLVNREGSRVELDVSVDRSPSVQQVPGSDLHVLDSSGESSGNITLDLRRPVPVSGKIETSSTVTYGEPESPVKVIQTSRATSAWEPSDAPEE
ncbi:MAG: hypothetical protein ACTH1D_06425 [Mycobacteriaceae bacterium]|uniref:hypothetical protein n=1 Tax=Corynebacterium sp. TaxID=1720 RepID=UPI003F996E4F